MMDGIFKVDVQTGDRYLLSAEEYFPWRQLVAIEGSVPEPASGLLLVGAAGLLALVRRRQRRCGPGAAAVLAVLCLSAVAGAAGARERVYQAVEIGALGGSYSSAAAVNNIGQVVGTAANASGAWHAYRWQDGAMLDLGLGQAYGINSDGDVVGHGYPDSSPQACVWTHGQQAWLSELPGYNASYAYAINDAGTIVGAMQHSGRYLACRWDGQSCQSLGSLGGADGSKAYAVNNHGVIVGMARAYSNSMRPCLFAETPVDLTAFTGATGQARDVNDLNQIVGHSSTYADGEHAFVATPEEGGLQDLGQWWAMAVNNRGDVVGQLQNGQAVLYLNGALLLLDDLVGGGSELEYATDINDYGWITVRNNGDACLLRNVPGDTNWDGRVDDLDSAALDAAFGARLGDPTFDYGADLSLDGIVDETDRSILERYRTQGGPTAPEPCTLALLAAGAFLSRPRRNGRDARRRP